MRHGAARCTRAGRDVAAVQDDAGALQSQFFNASQLGQSLGGASHSKAARYLDTLVDAMVVRRLSPNLPNVGKGLMKSPEIYVRDSEMLHALLGFAGAHGVQPHPMLERGNR